MLIERENCANRPPVAINSMTLSHDLQRTLSLVINLKRGDVRYSAVGCRDILERSLLSYQTAPASNNEGPGKNLKSHPNTTNYFLGNFVSNFVN